jgi:hypothetical protein
VKVVFDKTAANNQIPLDSGCGFGLQPRLKLVMPGMLWLRQHLACSARDFHLLASATYVNCSGPQRIYCPLFTLGYRVCHIQPAYSHSAGDAAKRHAGLLTTPAVCCGVWCFKEWVQSPALPSPQARLQVLIGCLVGAAGASTPLSVVWMDPLGRPFARGNMSVDLPPMPSLTEHSGVGSGKCTTNCPDSYSVRSWFGAKSCLADMPLNPSVLVAGCRAALKQSHAMWHPCACNRMQP